jgi:hypothetical protein
VECEPCGTKRDSMRRISLGALPNLLILHLKRFDLDYTTFETVKLNNRWDTLQLQVAVALNLAAPLRVADFTQRDCCYICKQSCHQCRKRTMAPMLRLPVMARPPAPPPAHGMHTTTTRARVQVRLPSAAERQALHARGH